MLFVDDLVLFDFCKSMNPASYSISNGLAAACYIAVLKISTSKTVMLHFSSYRDQCSLQVCQVLLKQMEKLKYLGVAFTTEEAKNEELMFDQAKQVL